ncbi:hypothetical protein VB774_03130 [Pseudanabaena galeata UHCC 0370]|uniref:Uncharacterized protein n=1 Tax=Pseudanabaena galeata UHCC 0370 TaxID=3110310 RepID=A0ABU5TEB5_9CYAN|nr:hypothetical protein [Pseudanabaena galeata]MEA5476603.1 hypothetical protein [Pseudanabaena galeata UHCC 0370]
MNDFPDKATDTDRDRLNPNSVDIREMNIDDIAPIFHLGEQLFTSDLYPYSGFQMSVVRASHS